MFHHACREFLVSIAVVIGVTLFASIICYLLPIFIMESICNDASGRSLIIYDRFVYGLPIGGIVCSLQQCAQQTPDVSNLLLWGGGLIFIAIFAFNVIAMYKMCSLHIALIYHFNIPYSQRKYNFLSCLFPGEYVSELLWSLNFATSCIFLIPGMMIYVIGRLVFASKTVGTICTLYMYYFPIVYYAIVAIIKICRRRANTATMREIIIPLQPINL